MRIISGRWRSRKIEWPATGKTRPITDRVREAVFDVLGSRFGTLAELPPVCVADVFAGGGSLGIEALSRGATRACFFERDRAALEILKQNLESLSAGPEAVVVPVDVYRHGVRPPVTHRPLELIFLDPPFGDSTQVADNEKLGILLRRLGTSEAVNERTLVVLRHEGRARLPEIIGRTWQAVERRTYGRNVIDLLEHLPAEPAP